MNIREYYQKTSVSNFHASWISLVLAIAFFICHAFTLISGNILLITAPFIVLSFVQFTNHRIYEHRIKDLPVLSVESGTECLQSENFLLTFMPAPTLRLLLFAPNGSMLGEIRDRNMKWFMWMVPNTLSILLPKRYELVNHEGHLLAMFNVSGGLTNKVSIMDHLGNQIGNYQESEKKSLVKIAGMFYKNDKTDWMYVETSTGLHSFEIKTCNGEKVATYQEGWMPLEWGKRFKTNTPILTFLSQVDGGAKVAILGLCAAVLHHRSN